MLENRSCHAPVQRQPLRDTKYTRPNHLVRYSEGPQTTANPEAISILKANSVTSTIIVSVLPMRLKGKGRFKCKCRFKGKRSFGIWGGRYVG